MKTLSPIAIANYFLEIAESRGESLTPMQLVKLVYLAHGWHLGLLKTPLISESVEAWKYGPVIRSVYNKFKHYGSSPIASQAIEYEVDKKNLTLTTVTPTVPDAMKNTRDLITRVYDVYGGLSGGQLSNITHEPDTPWHQFFESGKFNVAIPNSCIKEHYESLSRKGA